MYKIMWDKETGGVLLSTHITSETLGIAPRPVFFEELDLLGLDKLGWTYPHAKAPLMWAVNKQYFYRGQRLFDAKGANIYNKPTLEFYKHVEPIELRPVDIEAMLAKTSELMFVLENEAIEFIRDTFIAYTQVNQTFNKADANQLDYVTLATKAEKRIKKKMAIVKQDCDSFDIMPLETAEDKGKRIILSTKIERFIASFSGGKDSQVVLDLCTRAIPPTDFEVIYSDTGYELPSSLELYEEVQSYYKKRFPSLKFHIARNHESVLHYWDLIGTPSDTHRWCCSIMKTVPLYRMLRSNNLNKNTNFLAFEGVRADESVKRNDYNRIGKGVKHSFVVNARPILNWNTTEVFLYLFRHNLLINKAYRVGKPRVGCILCPFGSPWDDMIVNTCFPDKLKPFLTRIEKIVNDRDIPNKLEYIADRKWKVRGSGKFSKNETSVRFAVKDNQWEAIVKNANKDILDWLPAVGIFCLKTTGTTTKGDLLYQTKIYAFEIIYNSDKRTDFSFVLYDDNNIQLRHLLRKVVNKSAYCINCEACELECSFGALSVYPKIQIDKNKCVHCHKCLNYHNIGCIVADSLQKPSETNISNMKISSYGTFGIHQEWVEQYLQDPDSFWDNNKLGIKQVPSFKAWLKDADIIDNKGQITEFGSLCKKINKDRRTLLWEIIYINLTYNNSLMKWYTSSIPFDVEYSREELNKLAIDYFQSSFKETTITYAVQALVQSFKYSPIGNSFFQCLYKEKNNLKRQPYNKISHEAVAYSLYKYAQNKGILMFRVADLYRQEEKIGLYKEFGVSKDVLLKSLRYLSSDKNRVLVAELNMGLDHITLRDDLTPFSVLKEFIK